MTSQLTSQAHVCDKSHAESHPIATQRCFGSTVSEVVDVIDMVDDVLVLLVVVVVVVVDKVVVVAQLLCFT